MKKLNCDVFKVNMQFSQRAFKTKLFKESYEDSNSVPPPFSFVTHLANKHDHAHVELVINGKDSTLSFSMHNGGIEEGLDPTGSEVNSFFKNSAKFFSKETHLLEVRAIYRFDKKYESLVKLNYPLMVNNSFLEDGIISGHEIDFPDDPILNRIFVSSKNEDTIIAIGASLYVDLTEFDVYENIEDFLNYAKALVKKIS